MFFSSSKALAKTGIKFRFRIALTYKDIVLLGGIKIWFESGIISLIREATKVVTLEISSILCFNITVMSFSCSLFIRVLT